MSGERDFDPTAEFPRTHFTITPSDTVDLPQPMAVMAGTTGTIAVVDKNDTVVVYTISTAPMMLPVIAKRINATSTTVTQAIGLF